MNPKTNQPNDLPRPARPFLGIHFTCCNIYGRIYKNAAGTAYVGNCPQCRSKLTVPVGEGGTAQRFFSAG